MKKFLSIFLAVAMLLGLLAGCSTPEEEVVDTPAANAGAETPETPDAPETPETPEEPEEAEEPTEIKVALMFFAPIDQAIQDRIEGVVNELMVKEINVVADFTWYDANTYLQQVPMMLASGEQLDVIMFTPIPVAGYSSFMAQGQLMDISEYVDEYGADIKATLGQAGLDAMTKDGGLYGAGFATCHTGGAAICMRTDVLEETGMLDKFNTMTSWAEFEEILLAAQAAGYPGLANSDAEGTVLLPQPYMTGPESFTDAYWVDVAGDGNQMIYIDPETNTVKSYFASEGYKEGLLRTADLYAKGLIYQDAATAEEYADQQIKNGVGTAIVKALEFGWEGSLPVSCGYPMSVHFIDGAPAQLATSTFTKFGFGVPVTAQEPEAAVKFINLMYSANDVHNAIVWGEEGVDWVKSDIGTAVYPEGVEMAEYHNNDFMYGGVLEIIPWGDNPNLREEQKAANETMVASPYVGFSIDNVPVANLVTACQAVTNQYKPMLGSGAYGDKTEEMWQEWMNALEAAGINEIIAEYQRQLDAWLAAK